MCMLHFWQVHIMVTQHASLNSLQEGSVCSMYNVFTVGLQGDSAAPPCLLQLLSIFETSVAILHNLAMVIQHA
jgi:hypothetical protein